MKYILSGMGIMIASLLGLAAFYVVDAGTTDYAEGEGYKLISWAGGGAHSALVTQDTSNGYGVKVTANEKTFGPFTKMPEAAGPENEIKYQPMPIVRDWVTLQTLLATLPGADTVTVRLSGKKLLIANSATIPHNVELIIPHGTVLSIADGVTLTVNGILTAGAYKIFDCSGTGKVIYGREAFMKEVLIDWWGITYRDNTIDNSATINRAIECIRNSGSRGTVKFGSGDVYIKNSIIFVSGINLLGAGGYAGTHIRGNFDGNVFCFDPSYDTPYFHHGSIKDFNISGYGKHLPVGIAVNQMGENSFIEDIVFEECSDGIRLGQPGSAYANQVSANIKGISGMGLSRSVIHVLNSTGLIIITSLSGDNNGHIMHIDHCAQSLSVLINGAKIESDKAHTHDPGFLISDSYSCLSILGGWLTGQGTDVIKITGKAYPVVVMDGVAVMGYANIINDTVRGEKIPAFTASAGSYYSRFFSRLTYGAASAELTAVKQLITEVSKNAIMNISDSIIHADATKPDGTENLYVTLLPPESLRGHVLTVRKVDDTLHSVILSGPGVPDAKLRFQGDTIALRSSGRSWEVVGELLTYEQIDWLWIGEAMDGKTAPSPLAVFAGGANKIKARIFRDGPANEDVIFNWKVPHDLVGGAIKYRVRCLVTADTGPAPQRVTFALGATSIGSEDRLGKAASSDISSSKIVLSATPHTVVYTDWSADTIPLVRPDDLMILRLYRNSSPVPDAFKGEIGVIGIDLLYFRRYKN